MRVRLCAADHEGCCFYRMAEPGRCAQLEGISVDLAWGIPSEIGQETEDGPVIERLRQGDDDYPYDVIVFARPCHERILQYIPELQRKGIAVVVELDDDLSCVHANHPGKPVFDGRVDPAVSWRIAAKAASIADLVTVTTPELAERFAPHGRVAVLPNRVPAWTCDLPKISEGNVLGYTGAIYMHFGDLEVTHGGVQMALDENPNWSFLKVGGGAELAQRGLGLKQRPTQTRALAIDDFHAAIPMLDVGIAPLADSRFNQGKSWLKGIEYAACGVPFVASELPDYVRLHEQYGLGLLTKAKGRSWKSAIKLLLEDSKLREESAAQGRETVREHHTMESNSWRWVEAWQTAIDHRLTQGRP